MKYIHSWGEGGLHHREAHGELVGEDEDGPALGNNINNDYTKHTTTTNNNDNTNNNDTNNRSRYGQFSEFQSA